MRAFINKIIFIMLICSNVTAYGEQDAVDLGHSVVYFSNNTNKTLNVQTHQSGRDKLSNDNWQQLTTTIEPYTRKNVLLFSRYSGVKPGLNYEFETDITGDNIHIKLNQLLAGKVTHSEMSYGLSEAYQATPLYADRNIHTLSSENNNELLGLRATISNHLYDDLEYVIHQPIRKPILGDANTLDIISYNIFLMPFGLSADQDIRAKSLPKILQGYDMVFLAEALDTNNSPTVLNGLLEDYPYQSQIVSAGSFINGGAAILSRWPIEFESEHVYVNRNLETYDALANKGIKYLRINKLGKIYHVFATHTHAWSTEKSLRVRWQQLQELKQFILSQNIPSDEPVLVGGDLNVDKLLKEVNFEYPKMLELLNLAEPQYLGYKYSFDPSTNYYVTSEKPEYIDYIFTLKDHEQPKIATNTIQPTKAFNGLLWGKWDLSDHYPVIGHFEF